VEDVEDGLRECVRLSKLSTSEGLMETQVEQALSSSVLNSLPQNMRDLVLADDMRVDIPAGSILYREGGPPRCGLLVSGLARVFVAAPDGRQATIRYMRPGSLSGASLVVLGTAADVRVQAVTDVVGLLINVAALRQLARQEADVAWSLATEVARSQDEIMRAFSTRVFGSVRQRLARHLLDLAAARLGPGQPLLAPVTQQELADAVGSTREVVARELGSLRRAGLVDTGRGGVGLLDPAALHAVADPGPGL
jgi:CRP/FNR family cyclic AMP-dependent transcriptional regulator